LGGSFGPLSLYIKPYLAQVREQGYAVGSLYEQLHVLKMCDRWMERTEREVRDLDEAAMCDCLRRVGRRGYGKNAGASTLRRLLGMLRRMGAAPPPKTESPGQMEQLIGRYECFLLDERNLTLRLEDIDWENARITICGKGGKWSQLPLPSDVAKAIAHYLRDDRPRCASRRLFIRDYAPIDGFQNANAIASVVKRALKRAGVISARKGAHLLRHSLATEMLRKGASLDEIGEVLRHRSSDTTAIYAKVDLKSLRALALPWPGGVR
jgi:integrase